MSWFKENKFAGTVLGITAVVSGALVYLGFNARSEANLASARELAAVDKINSLQSTNTFPNDVNEEKLEGNLLDFVAEAKNFQNELVKFRPAEFKKLTPDTFNGEASNYFKKLDEIYKNKNVKFLNGGNQHYGLSRYAGLMAQENDTAYLNYNKRALEWLFETLANSGIESVDHVYREPVAEKLSSPKEPVVDLKRRKKAAKTAPVDSLIISDLLPIELTVSGSESNLQQFLSEVTASKEYFFALKLIKIQNEKRRPISISQMSFAPVVESEDSDGPDFGDIDGLEDDNTFVQDQAIIKQVVGAEKITVFLKFDLHLFRDASGVIIPRVDKLAASN